MKLKCSQIVWTAGLMGVGVVALAGEPGQAVPLQAVPLQAVPGQAAPAQAAPVQVAPVEAARKAAPAQEPVGFITGGVIGGFAAGPVGAVIGAGLGTWLGNRVHRAGEAAQAESAAAKAEARAASLSDNNLALTARLEQMSQSVAAAQSARDDAVREAAARDDASRDAAARDDAAEVLDGLQGDILFRTGSADITPEMAHGIEVLAEAVAKSPALKVRVDGYADARGGVQTNLKLSAARANAVRDLLLAAGVDDTALEINAYGKSQSTAVDNDGYALERRVRLTLQAAGAEAVARTGPAPEGAVSGTGLSANRSSE